MRRVIDVVALGLAFALLAGHAGWLHPALDSFSHLRPQIAVATVVAGLLALALRRVSGPVALLIGAGSVALTVPYYLGHETVGGPADLVVLQQNLRYDNRHLDAFERRVGDVSPDLIALQEVRGPARAVLGRLAADYPHQRSCRGASPVGDVVILSRHPFHGAATRCAPGLALALVDAGEMPFWFGALHLHWPWPAPQAEHLERITPALSTTGSPLVLVGDFNAVPWSHAVREIERRTGTRALRGLGGTRTDPDWPEMLRPAWNLPIDQILRSPDIEIAFAETLPLPGSDHLGVVAGLRLPGGSGGGILIDAMPADPVAVTRR